MINGIATGETRKDFFEFWKSNEKAKNKTDKEFSYVIDSLDRFARYSGLGYTITNWGNSRFERVNLDFMKPLSKLRPESFFKVGYAYTVKQMHEEYLDFNLVACRKIMKDELVRYSFEKRPDFEAFMDLHYKLDPSSDHYFRIFQHFKVLETDADNYPVLIANFCCDISFLKKKDHSTLAVKSANGSINFHHYDINTKCLNNFGTFSERELMILRLLEKGFSSRQIAENLFISPHTVDTHRRNMLEMTNCLNTTALIVYCKMIGW